MKKINSNLRIISGSSHPKLAKEIATRLGAILVDAEMQYFKNGEVRPVVRESVRGKDVIIIQTGSGSEEHTINDHIIEVVLLANTLQSSDAKSITLVMPCLAYARQDKKDNPRGSISAKYLADMIQNSGICRVIAMDLHSSQIQGFFKIPCDNLYAINLIRDFLWEKVFDGVKDYQDKFVIVAPDAGAFKNAIKYGEALGLKVIAVNKERDDSKRNEVERMNMIGDPRLVCGRTAIIIDDMCDTFGTVKEVSKLLVECGAESVVVCVTHGILSDPAMERLNNTPEVKMMLVSNSIPQTRNQARCEKLKVFSISKLLAEVISRFYNGESISELFTMERAGLSSIASEGGCVLSNSFLKDIEETDETQYNYPMWLAEETL